MEYKEESFFKEVKENENDDESENTLYECTSCNMSFLNVEEHLIQYHGDKEEIIEAPTLEDKTVDDLKNEEDCIEESEGMAFVVKNADGKFECQECYKTYKSVQRFIEHVKTHGSVAEENILKLEEHLQQLQNNSNEVVYEETSEASKANKFRCKICKTVFDTRKKVLLHYPIHKNVAAAVKKGIDSFGEVAKDLLHCKLCNRSLRTTEELKMHMNAHTENKTETKKAQPSSSGGEKKRKKGESSYPCQYCQKEFKRPHEKVKHERVHTGEKPYSCDICGKQFRVTYCLSLHKKNVHSDERPFVCSFEGCTKTFKSQSVYNHHLNTHGSAKNYKCPFCQKAFKTSVQLAGHKNTHTKPFPCQVCGRAFASLYAVRIHTENHQNVGNSLKYKCTICPAQYGRSFALSDHIKTAHDMEIDEEAEEVEEHYVIEESQEGVDDEVYALVVDTN